MNSTHNIGLELILPFLIYEYVTSQHPSSSSYEKRKMWQKVGYLSQQMGLPLDEYKFSWYKAGPYSSGFTSLLYSISDNYNQLSDEIDQYALNQGTQAKLNPLKKLVAQKPFSTTLTDWLELLASLLYFKKNHSLQKEPALKKLKRLKPHFADDFTNSYAWELLEENNLL